MMKNIEKLLAQAGIRVTREREREREEMTRRWEVIVNDEKAFQRAVYSGILGIGESYTDGEWDCEAIDELVHRLLSTRLLKDFHKKHPTWALHAALGYVANTGTRSRAKYLAKKHYDLGNDLFQAMLDPRMAYTCAYWKDAKTLPQAQEQKLEMVCQKLQLKPGMKVLDIGGGWGSFAKYAAERYKVSVVNITISKEQVKLANKLCEGLPVENRLMDYRDLDLNEKFDAVVSIEMFEAVGHKNYRKYMEIVHLLKRGTFSVEEPRS